MAKVQIPGIVASKLSISSEINLSSNTVYAMLEDMFEAYPESRDLICGEDGKLRRFVNIFVDGEDIRFMDGMDTKINESSEITMISAVAGG